jgi:3-oxoacyl-[acyl-carrier-protein] synthase-3
VSPPVRRAGITAVASFFPEEVRDNTYFEREAPAFVAALRAREAAPVWRAGAAPGPWQAAMAPHLADPFRGARQRRALAPGQTALDLERGAAEALFAAARIGPDDLDLVLVSSLFPDQPGIGDAFALAVALGLRCPCVNLESACGSVTADLLLACGLVEAGRARRVMIVTASTYTRAASADNPMAITSGDGAAALLVEAVGPGLGLIGASGRTTLRSAGALRTEVSAPGGGLGWLRMAANPGAADALEACCVHDLPAVFDGALAEAGLDRGDLRMVIVPTSTAWFTAFARDHLRLRDDQLIDTFPQLGNTGPVLVPQNLHCALAAGRLRPGDAVGLIAMGSLSTCGAAVMRLGDVAVGPPPPGAAGPGA